MSGQINTFFQKLKPEEKAKDFAYALPHVGAGIVFTSAIAVVAMQVASHFSEKAGEMVGKLGSEKLFYFTAVVGALTAIAGIAYLGLYFTTRKENKQMQQDNQQLQRDNRTLKAGIDYVAKAGEANTDLAQIKTNKVFTDAKEIAQA
ncbi:MAG: hypothetical protein U0X86_000476 [Wolbachia endosymbiont of Xenopsylla cheopis]